jgi:hypothetical protein
VSDTAVTTYSDAERRAFMEAVRDTCELHGFHASARLSWEVFEQMEAEIAALRSERVADS